MNLLIQDKGQFNTARAFIDGIKKGSPAIPPEEIFEVTQATITASEGLNHFSK